jgi:hypothetical protein
MDSLYKKCGYDYQRETRQSEQVKGVDVRLAGPDGNIRLTDEKAATARNDSFYTLKTYSFELSTLNNPNHTGWLLNSESKTEDYALIYFNRTQEGIDKCETIIVEKDKIMEKVAEKGLNTIKAAEDKVEDILYDITNTILDKVDRIAPRQNTNSNFRGNSKFELETEEGKIQLFLKTPVDLKKMITDYETENGKQYKDMSEDERNGLYDSIIDDIVENGDRVALRYNDGTSLVCTMKYEESPINYLLPRENLREMSKDIINYDNGRVYTKIRGEIREESVERE